MFKKFVIYNLKLAAKILLARKKPEVIAITGSAGKTSTKEFLKKLLEIDFEVLSPSEGYNTEIGAPLALFGISVPPKIKSIPAWISVMIRSYARALFVSDYPQKVIVEMGADKLGDIKYLASVFKPNVGVILSVLPTHLAEFKTEIGVAAEKSELAKTIGEDGKLFLNADDSRVKQMATLTPGRVIFFGTGKGDGYFAQNLKTDIKGTEFELKAGQKTEKIIARLYGRHMIYPLLASIAVAAEESISLKKIKDEVKDLAPFKGRMNLIEGMNGSIIIDDSYNANPKSMSEALKFLCEQDGRRIAVIGSMNELGDHEKDAHIEAGKLAAKCANVIVTVGEAAGKYLAPAAQKEGMKLSDSRSFKTAIEAGNYLKKIILPGDVILVKGSQNNVRTEKAIEIIMKDPMERKKLLVRQSEFWQDQA